MARHIDGYGRITWVFTAKRCPAASFPLLDLSIEFLEGKDNVADIQAVEALVQEAPVLVQAVVCCFRCPNRRNLQTLDIEPCFVVQLYLVQFGVWGFCCCCRKNCLISMARGKHPVQTAPALVPKYSTWGAGFLA